MSSSEIARAQIRRDLRNEIERRVMDSMNSVLQLVRDDPELYASLARTGLIAAFGIAVSADAYRKGKQKEDLSEDDIMKAMQALLVMALGE